LRRASVDLLKRQRQLHRLTVDHDVDTAGTRETAGEGPDGYARDLIEPESSTPPDL